MIRKIEKELAVALAQASLGPARGSCAMCYLAATNTRPLAVDNNVVLVFNRFPLRWGHLLVIPKQHSESFGELDDDSHAAAARLVVRASRTLENVLSPERIYTASLGAAKPELMITGPHLHWHVVPVGDERPADVFTWSLGILTADVEDWLELENLIRREIDGV